ncbi:hypothetical protein [Mesorhizobium onobrychidis]|uniref:Uncharacterized protein n=1 Tax=Mesorhizobium onobrychidis TaxID=2775404 RepID=A0ABY5R2W5_9HYPH|nr:hypothetical protein [Mesorhizobium onobrychidis]UVC17628.1 hypothetical protein IHQ72_11335 [Mesorhizobium onobrychidis]
MLKTPGVTSVRVQTLRGHSNTYRFMPDSTPGKRSTVIGHGLLQSDDAPEPDFTIAIEDGAAVPDAKPRSGRVMGWPVRAVARSECPDRFQC